MINQVADNIRKLRKSRGLTQEELAHRLGIARQNYTAIEAGSDISISRLISIAKELDAEPYQLLLNEEHFSLIEKSAQCKALLANAIYEQIVILSRLA